MASGDPVVVVVREMPPATLFAQWGIRSGGSTPVEGIVHYAFDQTTIEYMDYLCRLVGYDGGGLTFTLPWMAPAATSGVCRWGVAIRRIADDAEDLDASHTYDFNDVDDTTASAAGEVSYPTVTFTDGADMDSWADGELAIVRVRRNASHANDTLAEDAQLLDLIGKET